MASDLGKGQLDLLLLAVLEAGPSHGYAVITALKDRSAGRFDLAEGTVYPSLHRLEMDGLITSHADRVNGRSRRVYSLTPRGHRALAHGRAEFEQTVHHVRMVLAVAR
jgi:DNA-binding PadR family transcriptional regulator